MTTNEPPVKEDTLQNVNGSSPASIGGEMSIWEHLDELRGRLLRSVIVIVGLFLMMLLFTEQLLVYLAGPYTEASGRPGLQVLEPTENIVIYFRVALMSAGILGVPYLTYQILMFVIPGLTDKERRYVITAVPVASGFFLLGVAFTWFIMVPAAFDFLVSFQDDVFITEWTARRYIAFLTSILFWMGVAFEMPVVMYVLGRLGLIGPQTLIESWRFAVVAISITAALITPTVDPFNMMLVMGPLIGLYVLSIAFVAAAQRTLQRSLDGE
jgi:sec-independent protein translocase protein TatC